MLTLDGTDFSEEFSGSIEPVSKWAENTLWDDLTRQDIQANIDGAGSGRVPTNNSATSSAVMPSERVIWEILLTEGTAQNAPIILPADDRLLNLSALISLPSQGP
jgi:hypothetical protein